MKRIYRKVFAIKTQGKTQQGNPRAYWYLLECGHVLHKFHSASASIDRFTMIQKTEVKKICRKCMNNRSTELDFIRKVFGSEYSAMIRRQLKEE